MPYLHGRINYVDVFKNEVPSVFSLREKGTWSHQHTAIEYVVDCIRPAAGELWTCTLGSCSVNESHPADDGLQVASRRGQL